MCAAATSLGVLSCLLGFPRRQGVLVGVLQDHTNRPLIASQSSVADSVQKVLRKRGSHKRCVRTRTKFSQSSRGDVLSNVLFCFVGNNPLPDAPQPTVLSRRTQKFQEDLGKVLSEAKSYMLNPPILVASVSNEKVFNGPFSTTRSSYES